MTTNAVDSSFVHPRVLKLSRRIEQLAGSGDPETLGALVNEDAAQSFREVAATVPAGALLPLALLGDCLRVAKEAIDADGRRSPAELRYVRRLVGDAARYFRQARESYAGPEAAHVAGFLDMHANDGQAFGGAAKATAWIGLDLCGGVGDRELLRDYEALLVRLLDEIVHLEGASPEEEAVRERLAALIQRRRAMPSLPPARARSHDERLSAFLRSGGPQVFAGTAYLNQVFLPDPHDVESIHDHAREVFGRLLERAAEGSAGTGRMLLIKGESGAGKTHLMRAFRTHAHRAGLGHVGYMQMSSAHGDYGVYALRKTLDSLEHPHAPPELEVSSLRALSDALMARLPEGAQGRLDAPDDAREASFVAAGLADELLRTGCFEGFDPDFLRAMLLLQRDDPPQRARVLKYLRCEPLGGWDQRVLGDIAVGGDGGDAQRRLASLARLVRATGQGALVLLVDQLEDVFNLEQAPQRFLRALDVLRALVSAEPNAIVVVSCLEQFYVHVAQHLSRASRDRLEHDPEPVRLTGVRRADEVEQLLGTRLAALYDQLDVEWRDDEPLYPLPREWVAQLAQLRTRDVIENARRYQERCIAAGAIVSDTPSPGPGPEPKADDRDFATEWSDALGESVALPGDEEGLAALLAECAPRAGDELGLSVRARAEGRFVQLRVGGAAPLDVGVANRGTRGGGLKRQLDEHAKRTAPERMVIVRSGDFRMGARALVAKRLGELIGQGARRFALPETDWRSMAAYGAFAASRVQEEGFARWRREARVLSALPLFEALFEGASSANEAAPPPEKAAPEPSASPPEPVPVRPSATPAPESSAGSTPAPEGALRIGRQQGLRSQPVELDPEMLKRHSAFLGSPGSGKTTLALAIIEQLAERGLPAVLLDRKGDLATYADPSFGAEAPADEGLRARWETLRERLVVDLYTPGSDEGRSLRIPLAPADLGSLPPAERGRVAKFSAAALASMLGYTRGRKAQTLQVILQKGLEVLAELVPGKPPTLEGLMALLDDQDDALLRAVGKLDPKHFATLVQDLQTLRLSSGHLVGEGPGEVLDVARMFAREDGKTRLTVVSTRFLGDATSTDFWVASFLSEIARWSARSPARRLQGVLMLDEADAYLPATSKPATKEPLQDLLRRARSAGLGVMIATQNPGDLDYKGRDNISTWFVGRIAAEAARKKMKPLFAEARESFAGKLANAGVGEFYMLTGGHVTSLRSDRAVMDTRQLGMDEIERLARATVSSAK